MFPHLPTISEFVSAQPFISNICLGGGSYGVVAAPSSSYGGGNFFKKNFSYSNLKTKSKRNAIKFLGSSSYGVPQAEPLSSYGGGGKGMHTSQIDLLVN